MNDSTPTRSPVQLRLVEAGGVIQADGAVGDDIAFQHAVLCQIGLPRKSVDGHLFERRSGSASLLVKAGELHLNGRWVAQPVPYGTKPRLALIHLCTEAVRTRNPEVDVGDSVREFLRRMGLGDSGREYGAFRKQMAALAACELRLGFGNTTLKCSPVREYEAWLANDGNQRTLWPGMIRLTNDFYDALVEHAVPLDSRAVAALRHSALALDMYTWLAHRLWRVKSPVKVFWGQLHQQFGQEFGDLKNFKKEAIKALKAALMVYPEAKVEQVTGGLLLRQSKPPVFKTTYVAPWALR